MASCSNCHFPYKENITVPKSLRCGHTFCQPCIIGIFQIQKIFICPACQYNTESIQELEQIPTNLELLKLIKEFHNAFSAIFPETGVQFQMKHMGIHDSSMKKKMNFSQAFNEPNDNFVKTREMCIAEGCFNNKAIKAGHLMPFCSDQCQMKLMGTNNQSFPMQSHRSFVEALESQSTPRKSNAIFGERTQLTQSPLHRRSMTNSYLPNDRVPFQISNSGANTPKAISRSPSNSRMDNEMKCVIPNCNNFKFKYGNGKTSHFCGQKCWNKWPDYPNGEPNL